MQNSKQSGSGIFWLFLFVFGLMLWSMIVDAGEVAIANDVYSNPQAYGLETE